ncbi:ankyrin repeat domain-containing protein [Flavobacterium lindanitolerans]|uniref:ankyrin repeat domain-containing protein n=1 Tax=Flavobacterium lindanitolerans TaxID=428988 RepID=UPI0027B89DF3|nr:ankyrin repeat domain-containing protein [Flavobacterium lindanitolerans]
MKKTTFLLLFFFLSTAVFSQKDIFNVARSGTVDEVKTLMKHSPDCINDLSPEGYSPLILACYRGNTAVADFLMQHVKDINAVSGMGTALMAASVKGNVEIVKKLLEKKANPNIPDSNGTTALIYASIFKNYEIAAFLIKAEADPYAKDNRGNSALDYAILSNDDKLIQILKTK